MIEFNKTIKKKTGKSDKLEVDVRRLPFARFERLIFANSNIKISREIF